MKVSNKFFVSAMLVMAAGVALAQTVIGPSGAVVAGPQQPSASLPTSLSGEWRMKLNNGREFSNPWAVRSIDLSVGTGVMDFKSSRPGCSIQNAPLKVEYDGVTLKVAVINPNKDRSILPCSFGFRAELKRGPDAFEGKAWSDVVGSADTDAFVYLK